MRLHCGDQSRPLLDQLIVRREPDAQVPDPWRPPPPAAPPMRADRERDQPERGDPAEPEPEKPQAPRWRNKAMLAQGPGR